MTTAKIHPDYIKLYLRWLKKPSSLYMSALCLCTNERGREQIVEIQLPALPLTDLPQRRKEKKNDLPTV